MNVSIIERLVACIYSRPLETDREQYDELKDEFVNVGSDIAPAGYGFDKWKNGNSVLCVNFTKHSKDKLINGNSACSISVDIIPHSTNPSVDYYCILERKKSMILNMSSAGTTAVVGDGYWKSDLNT